MKQEMLINAVHPEQKRMATVEDGKLIEFDIQMSFKQPITGNIYKGIVLKVERGLQAAFVNYGTKKDGFLPLRDVSPDNFPESNGREGSHVSGRPTLKVGQEILVQVLREVSGQKGALLTAYISLPGRYLVLLPNKESSGVSRKIEDEGDRKRLKEIVEQIKKDEGLGFIVRTAGMSRTKQELSRDYQHLLRLWQEIQKKAKSVPSPALIYQESDFGVRTLRDYFTPEITAIWVDDQETFKKMRAYCKAIVPRNLKIIQLYKEKTPIFDRYQLEDQIRSIYQERVTLKSGGSVIIKPTEAMITIDVNSGRGSHKKNVEETAFKTNLEAAEEIARQLRLRDLGGLIVIDFIDMMDRKNIAEVEKTFKKALSLDRARIQLARISKFGIMELSRQKKHSTIQEISYIICPLCHGSGIRPSLEYAALSAFRKMESQAVKGAASLLTVSLPSEVAGYLLNQKRSEICKLETEYEMAINIQAVADMVWDAVNIEATTRKPVLETGEEKLARLAGREEITEFESDAGEEEFEGITYAETQDQEGAEIATPTTKEGDVVPKKKSRRRRRNRHRQPASADASSPAASIPEDAPATTIEIPGPQEPEAAASTDDIPEQETVSDTTPAEPAPHPRRPSSRRRKRKTAHPAVVTDTVPTVEQAVIQETAAEPVPPSRPPLPRRRKKKTAHPPVVPVVTDKVPTVEQVSPEKTADALPTEPPPATRIPASGRRKKKVVPIITSLTDTVPTLGQGEIQVTDTSTPEPLRPKRRPPGRRRPKKTAEGALFSAATAAEPALDDSGEGE